MNQSLSALPAVETPLPTNLPSASIVIEWENARLAEAERAMRMLTELARQTDEIAASSSRQVDIVVLYNPEAIQRSDLEAMFAHARALDRWAFPVRLVEAGERTYYEQKNFGAGSTTGELVVLIDSDVVPEAGWLERMLSGFEDPEVGVVCGSTYIECDSFYDRSIALFWLFQLRTDRDEIEPADRFFGNNVAFRREVIRANPFPAQNTFRGHAYLLAKSLQEKGVKMVRQTGARVSHPPPNGLRHFINRAMCEGHDHAIRECIRGRKRPRRFDVRTFRQRMGAATSRIAQGYRDVSLSPVGAVGAWSVALAYNSCWLTGKLLCAINPEIVPKHFPMR